MHRVSVAAFAVLLLCGGALYVYKQSRYDPVKVTCAGSGKGEDTYGKGKDKDNGGCQKQHSLHLRDFLHSG